MARSISMLAGAFLLASSLSSGGLAADGDVAGGVIECLPVVGTFLTTKYEDGADGTAPIGRSLLSLTNGGHAFFTDSAEAGVPGFQPFSDARGAWRCTKNDGGEIEFTLVMLDFTFPTAAQPDQKIARIDTRASFVVEAGRLSGRTVVSFADLYSDPSDAEAFADPIAYRFEGTKIEVPAE
ncbi:MAG: hypothetical protein AAFX81_04220 [Pseudomonadota bacterium]